MDENDVDALLNLGELALGEDDFEGAVRHLNKAQEATGGQNGRVQELLGKAQRLLKQSKTRDYYKILSVARDADKREIKKAYRKLAQEWHPDKYSGELGPEAVEAKMAEINQAYEVLYDDGMLILTVYGVLTVDGCAPCQHLASQKVGLNEHRY